MEENNTNQQTQEAVRKPRKLLPIKMVLLLVVLVIALVGGWLFLQQEKTIEVDKDLTAQVAQPDATVAPTPFVTATPTPVPQVKVLDTETGYLNVRATPSIVGGELVGRVKPGETYEYTQEKEGWYNIVLSEDEHGWVFGEYVEVVEPAVPVESPDPPEASASAGVSANKVKILETPTGYLNVRNAPSLNGTRTGKVYPNEEYEFVAVEGDWYELVLPDGKTGWAYSEYVQELDDTSSFSPSQ